MNLKVKNTFKTDKKIKLINGIEYTLKSGDEKIVGKYKDVNNSYIFNLLKTGFEVSKISDEYVKDYMKIEDNISIKVNNTIDISDKIEKPKRKRGRPRKNPKPE